MRPIAFAWGLGILSLFASSCSTNDSTPDQNNATMQEEVSFAPYEGHKLVIYQVMTRLFGNTKTNNVTYGTIEENGVGKFNDFTPKALQAIRDLGVTHIWYTGVIEHATMTDYTAYGIARDDADVVKGRAGSPYAIKDYYDVHPDLAEDVPNRMAEFEALVARTHAAGLKVLIDFVPNHVARQYVSDAKPEGTTDFGATDDTTVAFDPQNNFYYLPGEDFQVPEGYNPLGEETHPTEDNSFAESPAKATGDDVFSATPAVGNWFETTKLNYGVDYADGRKEYFDPIPDTWLKMKDILLYWAGKGVDGFRCDMAHMVPVAFWNWVIPAVKKTHPDVIFLAEIYEPEKYALYFEKGRFDYQYDKVGTYDELRKMMEGTPNADAVFAVRESLDSIDPRMLRFLENHDEQRIAADEFAGNPQMGRPGMVVSATLGQGPLLLYFGQEVGEPGKGEEGFQGEDGRTTIFDYWGVPEHQKWMNGGAFDGEGLAPEQKQLRQFYRTLHYFVRESKALAHGALTRLNPSVEGEQDPNAIMSYLRHTDDTAVCVLANFSAEPVTLTLSASALTPFGQNWVELFTEEEKTLEGASMQVTIPAMNAQIWQPR